MPKSLDLANLYTDLGYIITGNYVQDFLFEVFPPTRGATTLEPGCGSGKFTLGYTLRGCASDGFDISESAVEYAHRLDEAVVALSGKSLLSRISQGNLWERLPKYESSSVDLVFNEGVPQHWPEDEPRQWIINAMARIARQMVVIIGNNGLNPQEQQVDRDFAFTYEGMSPHRRCFTPAELYEKMVAAGLRDVKVLALSPFPEDPACPVTIRFPGSTNTGRVVPLLERATLIAGYGRKE